MRGAGGDLIDALRAIIRTPVVAGVIIASIAIGVGVNTVVFSWVQARILRPIPGVDSSAGFYGVEPRTRNGQYQGASWLEYRDLRERLQSFQDLIAARITFFYVGEPGKIERVSGQLISSNYFSALDLQPAAGRFPSPSEMQGGGAPIAVISYGLAQKQFGGAAQAISSTIRVNGQQLTVVGVTAPEFQGTVTGLFFDVYLPAVIAADVLNRSTELVERGSRGYLMMGRLRDGVSAAQAQAELDASMKELGRLHPESNSDVRGEVSAAWNLPRGPARMLNAALGILQSVMLLVLVAVCGNIANLALAKGSSRYKELGIRMAMGASRGRIVRLLMIETTTLATLGAAIGAAMAVWGTNALRILPLTGLPLRLDTTIDGDGLTVALGLGLLSGIIIGAAPAWQMARMDPQVAFRTGARLSGRSRLRDGLMAAQAGLALMVLIATGISFMSYLQTRDTDPGFRQDGVTLATYDLSGRARPPAVTKAFHASLLDRVQTIAGVERAAIASSVPLDIHGLPMRTIAVEGRVRTDDAAPDQTSTNVVTPGYFEVMGITLLKGRDFSGLNDPAPGLEAIANETFVRRFLSDAEPLGRRVVARARTHTVVGVVRDSIANAFGEPPTPVLYFSYRDNTLPAGELHVRAGAGAEATLVASLRRAISEIDTEVPLFNVRTLTEHVDTNLFLRRIPVRMFSVIGPLLLALAAMGIYAVVAYSSAQRRVEVGVRIAMGALPGQIIRQFLREGMTVIAAGSVAGWLLALALSRRYVPDSIDARVFAVVPILLLSVAATACWLPARRASLLHPTEALRPD